MTIKFYLPVILLLLLCSLLSHAQNTPAQLSVKREEEKDASTLLKTVNRSVQDSNKVIILLKAGHIYWHLRKADEAAIDTCLKVSSSAYELAGTLHNEALTNEAAFVLCKALMYKRQKTAATELLKDFHGEMKVKLLLAMAEHYVIDNPDNTRELPTAYPLIQQALSICRTIHSGPWLNESLILLGKYNFAKGDIDNGKKAFMELIEINHNAKNFTEEARFWTTLASYIPENEKSYPYIIYCYEMALNRYLLANDKKNAGYTLRELAIVNANHGRTDSAGNQLQRMMQIFETIHERISLSTYYTLAEYYRFTAQYHQALRYAIKAIETPEKSESKRMLVYRSLAEIYANLADYENSLKYYRSLLDYQLSNQNHLKYISAYRIACIEGEAGRPRQALNFITKYIKNHPPDNLNQKQLFVSVLGDLNNQLGKYNKAEVYYKEMLRLDQPAQLENGTQRRGHEITLTGSGAQFTIGKYYAGQKRYKEAKYHLQQSLVNPQFFDAQQELDTYKLLFKVDSALGNYLPAIKNFERHKTMNDSLNSITRNNQLSELNIRFQTEQRKKDIKLLESTQRTQQAQIERSAIIRNVILGGAFLFFIIAVLAFRAYRIKQISNQKLFAKQNQINEQNTKLQSLLLEKEVFIKEKDWLLKEVHHRVKNNLQIVMSLLSTQSFYIQNEHAREAILQSENRVQSIALIHQKLYTSDNMASVSMPAYIGDLIRHLQDSFDTEKRKIVFKQTIEDVNIDLAQAVPIGLILNEAITNAIKYAFTQTGGQIAVKLKPQTGNTIQLIITDNGSGLPHDFDALEANSLGMEMMKGLTTQLKGTFKVVNNPGTTVCIAFGLNPSSLKNVVNNKV